MTSYEADLREVQKQLSSITECPICTDTYSDPRFLPCFHFFCLKCIKGFSKGKQPGHGVACPVCRKHFVIPDQGVDELSKNFFIEQLKDLTNTAGSRRAGRDETDINKRASGKTTYCKKHEDNLVELYCFDCKSALCTRCLVQSHMSHKFSVVDKAADGLRKLLSSCCSEMTVSVDLCKHLLHEQEQTKLNLCSTVDAIESEVCQQVEQLKELVDSEKRKLLDELQIRKKERLKQMQLVTDDIKRHMSLAGSLIKYTEELADKGSAADVAQQWSALRKSVDDLTNVDNLFESIGGLGSVKAKFVSAKTSVQDNKNLIGQIYWPQDTGKLSYNLNILDKIPNFILRRHLVCKLYCSFFIHVYRD
jgi:hypothetical protein